MALLPSQQERFQELLRESEDQLNEFQNLFDQSIKQYGKFLNTRARIGNLLNSYKEAQGTELFNQTEENNA